MKKLIPLTLASLFFSLVSCNSIEQQFSDGGANQTGSVSDSMEENSMSTPEHVSSAKPISKIVVGDFDEDGKEDQLFLSVNAEVDDKNRIAWDDAQIWKVYIKTDQDSFHLYSKDIQLGKLALYYDRYHNIIYLHENSPYLKRKFKIEGKKKFELVEVEELPDVENFEQLTFE